MRKTNSTGSLLRALLAAWVTIIFGTSVLIVLLSTVSRETYDENPLIHFLRSTWEVADEMGPAVKLSIIIVFSGLVILLQRSFNSSGVLLYGKNIVLAIVAVLLVLWLLPAEFSRGFGIGLTGKRFDMAMLPIYIAGAVLGGLVYTAVLARRRNK